MSEQFEAVIDEELLEQVNSSSPLMVPAMDDNSFSFAAPDTSTGEHVGTDMPSAVEEQQLPDPILESNIVAEGSSLGLGGYSKIDDSDVSVVEYGNDAFMQALPLVSSTRSKPKKIIITVAPSDLLGYPLFRISQCICVLRFQKSLVDIGADSDGIYRDLLIFPNILTFTSPSGIGFTKNLVVSIWRRHGISGFFRGFPEFIVHKFVTDVMTYVVPTYIAPKVEIAGRQLFKRMTTFEYGSLTHLRDLYTTKYSKFLNENKFIQDHRYLCFWEDRSFQRFVRRNIKFDGYEYLVKALVEFLTYPALTVSSKMMIYDGNEPMNAFSLLGGMIREDGVFSLYSGFSWQLLALLLQHLEKQNEIQRRQLSFTMDDLSTPLDQSVPIFLTIGQMLCQQISLVHRCGSAMDGFCSQESSISILSRFSWVNISSQLLLTVCLMHLKDRVLD